MFWSSIWFVGVVFVDKIIQVCHDVIASQNLDDNPHLLKETVDGGGTIFRDNNTPLNT